MLSNRSRSLLVAALFLGLLTLSATPSPAATWDSLWSWLALWTGLTPASPTGDFASGDHGPIIDPNGGNRTASAAAPLDQGPIIDPNGGNRTASAAAPLDHGPLIDPNGGNL